MWSDTPRSYGHSYGWIEPGEKDRLRNHIDLVYAAGKKAVLNYMSAYFYYSRDAREFVDNVQWWKDTYGIDGSEPTSDSPQYESSLTFTSHTTLKAAAFKKGLEHSRILVLKIDENR